MNGKGGPKAAFSLGLNSGNKAQTTLCYNS